MIINLKQTKLVFDDQKLDFALIKGPEKRSFVYCSSLIPERRRQRDGDEFDELINDQQLTINEPLDAMVKRPLIPFLTTRRVTDVARG